MPASVFAIAVDSLVVFLDRDLIEALTRNREDTLQ